MEAKYLLKYLESGGALDKTKNLTPQQRCELTKVYVQNRTYVDWRGLRI